MAAPQKSRNGQGCMYRFYILLRVATLLKNRPTSNLVTKRPSGACCIELRESRAMFSQNVSLQVTGHNPSIGHQPLHPRPTPMHRDRSQSINRSSPSTRDRCKIIRVTFLQQRDLSAKLTQTLEANRQKLRGKPAKTTPCFHFGKTWHATLLIRYNKHHLGVWSRGLLRRRYGGHFGHGSDRSESPPVKPGLTTSPRPSALNPRS